MVSNEVLNLIFHVCKLRTRDYAELENKKTICNNNNLVKLRTTAVFLFIRVETPTGCIEQLR